MGCQKTIAGAILDGDANYVLMAKCNQQEPKEQVEKILSISCKTESDKERETGHGSKETGNAWLPMNLLFSMLFSLPAKAKMINNAFRSHWSAENKLHWVLDVIFKGDWALTKKGNSALYFNIIAKMALTILKC